MQIAFAGTGVWLSDGGTNVLPVPVHRGRGPDVAAQKMEDRAAIHKGLEAALRSHPALAAERLLPGDGICIPRNQSRDMQRFIGSIWAACR